MRGLLGLLIIGFLFVIGAVLVGGVGDFYKIGDISLLSGGMVLLAAFSVLGGSAAALFSWVDVTVPTEAGIVTKRRYRPVMIGLAAILFVAAGFIVFGTASDAPLADLAAGDCFDEPAAEEISTVTTVSCNEPHDMEMFAVISVAQRLGSEYPGQVALDDEAIFECFVRFQAYVGVAKADSVLDIKFFTPTRSSWDEGNRDVKCAVYRLDGRQFTNSARGGGL